MGNYSQVADKSRLFYPGMYMGPYLIKQTYSSHQYMDRKLLDKTTHTSDFLYWIYTFANCIVLQIHVGTYSHVGSSLPDTLKGQQLNEMHRKFHSWNT